MSNTNKTTVVLFTAFTAAATLTATSAAHAQVAATPPAGAANVVAASPAAPATGATSADPNIDRGLLLPTAMTQPAGSVTYNNYELLLHGVTYGITDRVQGSVTVLSPIVRDMPFVGFAAVKGRIVSTDRFNLALQGSIGWGHIFNVTDSGAGDLYSGGVGAFASYCLRQDCSSLLSASATYQLAMAGSSDNTVQTVIYGGSIVHRVGRHLKLLGEVTSAAGRAGGETRKHRRRAGRLRRPLSHRQHRGRRRLPEAGHGRRDRRRLPGRPPVRQRLLSLAVAREDDGRDNHSASYSSDVRSLIQTAQARVKASDKRHHQQIGATPTVVTRTVTAYIAIER